MTHWEIFIQILGYTFLLCWLLMFFLAAATIHSNRRRKREISDQFDRMIQFHVLRFPGGQQ